MRKENRKLEGSEANASSAFPVLEVEGMDLLWRNKRTMEICPPDPFLAWSYLRGTRRSVAAESLFVLMPLPVISWRTALKMVMTGLALRPHQMLDGLPTSLGQLWKLSIPKCLWIQ